MPNVDAWDEERALPVEREVAAVAADEREVDGREGMDTEVPSTAAAGASADEEYRGNVGPGIEERGKERSEREEEDSWIEGPALRLLLLLVPKLPLLPLLGPLLLLMLLTARGNAAILSCHFCC